MKGQEHNTRIFLRTNEALKELIKEKSKEQGIGMSEYLRKLALEDCRELNNNQ